MAQALYYDDDPPRQSDNPQDPPRYPDSEPLQPTQPSAPQQAVPNIQGDLDRLRQQYGVNIDPDNAAKLARLQQSPSQNENYASYLKEIEEKQKLRARPTLSAGGIGGSADLNGDGRADLMSNAIAQAQGAGRTNFSFNNPGDQFDDPYTKALEDMLKQQIATLQQPQSNPGLDNLLKYLDTQFAKASGPQSVDPNLQQFQTFANQQFQRLSGPRTPDTNMDRLQQFVDTRFNELSQNPGYSPDELALLRTQSLEPIEQDRAAAQRRVLERTAQRGMLPSSGLTELDSREQDYEYDKLRGAAQRDLGVAAINRRDKDLSDAMVTAQLGASLSDRLREREQQDIQQAMQFGELGGVTIPELQRKREQEAQAQALLLGQLAGVTIPGMQRTEDASRRGESVALANMLYQLPRNALMDSLSVINGTPAPNDLMQQAIQLMNSQESQRRYNQSRNDQFWAGIGETLAGIFG